MKNTHTFPRYTTLTTKIVILGLLGRFLWLSALLFPIIWLVAMGAPLAGSEPFVTIASSVLITFVLAGFYLSNYGLYRLYNYFRRKKTKSYKYLEYIMYMVAPIPVLELKWLFGRSIAHEEVLVPAFIQRNPKGKISLTRSLIYMFFIDPEINTKQITEAIKRKSNYFATTRDDEEILVSTNTGIVVCLLNQSGKIYMFTEAKPSQQSFSLSSGWKLEYSQDMSAGAVVYEKSVDPLFDMDSETLSDTIIAAINNLLNKE